MKKICAVVLACLTPLWATVAEPHSPSPDPALVDAIIRKLESSGELDRAIDQGITRYISRQEDARRTAQAQDQAKVVNSAKNARKVSPGRDHIRGHSNATVSLIEYTDFECPFCKQFHATPKAVIDQYGGKVNWVLRHFPLPNHDPMARREAIASECAAALGGDEVFWKYADTAFARTRSNGNGPPEDKSLESLAAELGLDRGKFSRCLQDPNVAKRVDEDIAEASIFVRGTPTTLIRNNRTGATEVSVGAQPPETLTALVERVMGNSR